MRPTAHPQSALRTPLNDILGTEAAVRLLRILTRVEAPVPAGYLARRTSLNRAGVRKALQSLCATGIVEVSGEPNASDYALRREHPLARPLAQLFTAERARVDRLFEALREAARELTPPPIAVWLEGPVASGSDRPGDAIVLRLIEAAPALATSVNRFEEMLEATERQFDVTIEVRGATRADLATATDSEALDRQVSEAKPLAGLPPQAFLPKMMPPRRRARAHADHDEHLRLLAAQVADRVLVDPTLVKRAKAWIAHRLPKASSGEQHELEEWNRVLRTMSVARLHHFLVDPGARATRLRQTLPFLPAMSRDEVAELEAAATKQQAPVKGKEGADQ
jgi:predicted transcriptional regulator